MNEPLTSKIGRTRKTRSYLFPLLFAVSIMASITGGCARSSSPPTSQEAPFDKSFPGDEFISARLSAGDGTVLSQSLSSKAFSFPMPNLSEATLAEHDLGDGNFDREFIQGPDSGHPEFEGLGPSFNNRSCKACHSLDGRGSLPILPAGQLSVKFGSNEAVLLRISIEDATFATTNSAWAPQIKTADNGWGAPRGVPGFGTQLFHRGVYQLRGDSPGTGQADIIMSFKTREMTFPDGEVAVLRTPVFSVDNPYDAPGESAPASGLLAKSRLFQDDIRVSPRMGLPMIGLGLLEAIPESEILKLSDPDDTNGDGIRGRPNYVYDVIKAQARDPYPVSLGRFGWKASTPSVAHQAMAALVNDIGITNFLFPLESIFGTNLFDNAVTLGMIPKQAAKPEASDEMARSLIVYSQTLGVPARRNIDDPTVVLGARTFAQVNCTGCHTPSFTTGAHPTLPELSFQKIYPYSDGLLHDMGDELADGRRDFDAGPRDWKTRPLWGIGLTKVINPRSGFLHDGRARTLQEAILFHGGEADRSRVAYMALAKEKRAAVIAFLQSL